VPSSVQELLARERAAFDERTPASGRLYRRAAAVLAGGVSSSYHLREPWPVYLERGEGARVWDVDGNEYLDFHNGFGSMVQGHADPVIGAAVAARYAQGTQFGAPAEDAVAVAEELARRFGLPSWRFTSSGTESTMAAIRIARAFTGRDALVKVAGAYHGHYDGLLAAGGVEWGDSDALERLILETSPACVIAEGAMTSIGVVAPPPGWLDALRELTQRHSVVLVLDEVKTGLTIAAGGAVERYGIEPDMVTLAKSLGGGLPAGAVGMSPELARLVADGSVPQLGTFNGNPLSMAAARASLTEVLTPEAYERLERLGERLRSGCEAALAESGVPGHAVAVGSKGCVRFGPEPVVDNRSYRNRRDAELCELAWLWSMNRGLFATPGREHEWNVTVAHAEEDVDRHVEVFAELAGALATRPRSGSARA